MLWVVVPRLVAAQTEAPTLDGDAALRVPVQMPVPEPPAAAPALAATRDTRLMDLSTDLAEVAAREGGMLLERRWGGVADRLIWRGAVGDQSSDLDVSLDGAPLNLPLAGRAVGAVDLELLPVAAIERVEVEPGPFAGGYAGSLRLVSRSLEGAVGGFLFDERAGRRLSVAGGEQYQHGAALLAVEARSDVSGWARDDRVAMFGKATRDLGGGMTLALSARYFRDVWDDTDVSLDGGELWGLGGSAQLGFAVSRRVAVEAYAGALADRFERFATAAANQKEARDRNRVVTAGATLRAKPEQMWAREVSLSFNLAYQQARARTFATTARERQGTLASIDADYLRGGVQATVEGDLGPFEIGGLARADELTLRRDEPAVAAAPQTATQVLPSWAAWARYRTSTFVITLKLGHAYRTHPAAMTSGELAIDHSSGELSVSGELGLHRDLRLAWLVLGYASWYEGGVLEVVEPGNERLVFGGELGLDLVYRPFDLTLAARGGPIYGVQEFAERTRQGDIDRYFVGAAYVPTYAAHVGLMRAKGNGLRAEVWWDAYGPYPLSVGPDALETEAYQDASARIGYAADNMSLWVGGHGLLLGEPPALDLAMPVRRTFYAMLDLAL